MSVRDVILVSAWQACRRRLFATSLFPHVVRRVRSGRPLKLAPSGLRVAGRVARRKPRPIYTRVRVELVLQRGSAGEASRARGVQVASTSQR